MFKYLFWLGTREVKIFDPANTQEDSFKKIYPARYIFKWYNAKSHVDGKTVYIVKSR